VLTTIASGMLTLNIIPSMLYIKYANIKEKMI
jgi:hypothetical protein